METKVTFSDYKKVYTGSADNVQRGFFAYLRRLQKDAEAAQGEFFAQTAAQDAKKAADAAADAVKKAQAAQQAAKKGAAKQPEAEAAKQAAQEAKEAAKEAQQAAKKAAKDAQEAKKRSAADGIKPEALSALSAVLQKKGLRAADFTKEYLLQYLPAIFDANKQICSRKEIPDEEAQQTRKEYAEMPERLREEDGKLYLLRPRVLFTANSLLSLFTKAADAKAKAAKEAADGLTAAQKEAKKRAKYAEMLRRAQAYFAENPDAQEAQTEAAKQ